jgi:hypothetical protein
MQDQSDIDNPDESFDFRPSTGEEHVRRPRPKGRPVAKQDGLFGLLDDLFGFLGGFKGVFLIVFAIVFYFAYNAWQDSLEQKKQERMEQLRKEELVEPWFGK